MKFSNSVTPDHVRAETERRILVIWPMHRQINALRLGDEDVTARMGVEIDAIREAGQALRSKRPIPSDFKADKYWPTIS